MCQFCPLSWYEPCHTDVREGDQAPHSEQQEPKYRFTSVIVEMPLFPYLWLLLQYHSGSAFEIYFTQQYPRSWQ